MASPARAGTRQRILSATEELLGELGYNGMRLHQVAQRVGIQKSSLFHYFASKQALYRAALHERVRDGDELVRGILAGVKPPGEQVRALIEAYVDQVARNADPIRVLARHALGDAPPGVAAPDIPPLLVALVDVVREGRRKGAFAPVDEVALAISVVGIAAFLLAAAPVLFPQAAIDASSPHGVARVKQHVVAMVSRTLAGDADEAGHPSFPSGARGPSAEAPGAP
ncbi:MAG: TetR/AcrR family transcriptional regulator [Thermodesulfobacteriota bacterium]